MSYASSNAGALIGRRMGNYELVALLALGGTAEIYLARIGGVAGFEKYVVVKCLHDHLADDSEFVRMFLDEARLSAQLDHSNIVQTIELDEEDGRYFIVMEYLAGMSLSLLAKRASERIPGGRLPVDLTLCIAAQACAGLHYAHQRHDSSGAPLNVVHRDVSPQNLVISFEGIVKLVDFGIAKAEMRDTQTRSGTIKGKFAYMSPEQCTAGIVDHRTDIFAMGVVVHELLVGRRLFKRASTYDTYRAIVEDSIAPPSTLRPDLSPTLDAVIMKALAYEREDRYQSAEAFGEALTAALHKRGKAVSAGMVANFFDEYLEKEINEHRERMRALIAGRKTLTDGVWDEPGSKSDADDESDSFELGDAVHTVDISSGSKEAEQVRAVAERERERGERVRSSSAVRVSEVTVADALETTDDAGDGGGDDGHGEATRIEANPLAGEELLRLADDDLSQAPTREALPDMSAYADQDAALAQTLSVPTADGSPPVDLMMPSPADVVSGGVELAEVASPENSSRRPSGRRLPLISELDDTDSGSATLVAEGAAPVVPSPPRLPDDGRGPMGRPASNDFGTARTAPAGPMGLRQLSELVGGRPAQPKAGDLGDVEDIDDIDDLDDVEDLNDVDDLDDLGDLDDGGSELSQTVTKPIASGQLEAARILSQSRPDSMPALVSAPSAALDNADNGGIPVWLLAVLFVLSVGVGVGATLLVNHLRAG